MTSKTLCAGALIAVALALPAQAAEKIETKLVFSDQASTVKAKDSQSASFAAAFLGDDLKELSDVDGNKLLRNACFPAQDNGNKFLGAIASFLIGPVVNLATSHLKSHLDEELKKYGAEFKASGQSPFYQVDGSGEVVQNWRCFRVTRIRTITPDADETSRAVGPSSRAVGKGAAVRSIDFDFVGQVALVGLKTVTDPDSSKTMEVEDPDIRDARRAVGLKVRPLRVYVARPVAKGDKMGISGSATVGAIWRDGHEGKQASLFTTALFDASFRRRAVAARPPSKTGTYAWDFVNKKTKTSEPGPHFYYGETDQGAVDKTKLSDWADQPLQPLPAIASFADPGVAGGRRLAPAATSVTVAFAGAEVGAGQGRSVIKALSKLLGATQDDLDSMLTKAAKKVIEPDEPEPAAKPENYCGTFTSATGGGTIQWTKTDGACTAQPAS